MKKIKLSIIVLLLSTVTVSAQMVHATYFMNEWSLRHQLNASFAPEYGYLSLPVISGLKLSLSSSKGMDNFLFPYGSDHVTFMHKSVDGTLFLNKLNSDMSLNQGLWTNLLSFGFYTKKNSFWSFSFGLKQNLNINLPYDFFKLAKKGMQKQTNLFDLKNLRFNESNMMEAGIGFSKDFGKKLRIGLNAKMLVGLSLTRVNYTKFNVTMASDHFEANAEGEAIAAAEFLTINKDKDNYYDFSDLDFNSSSLKPAGYGAAFDLGVTYKPFKRLTLAAGVNDIGFINWKASSIKKGKAVGNVKFDGFTNIDVEDVDVDDQLDQLQDDAEKIIKFTPTDSKKIKESTPYTISASSEYSIFNNSKHDILLGMLWNHYHSSFQNTNELVANLSLKPLGWLTLSGNCELTRKDFNRYGVALNISPKWINIIIASDYVVPKVNHQYIPISKFDFNILFGVSFVVGRGRDSDFDGVSDRKDKCPDTEFGILVDRKGCPLDTDGDGVIDMYDKCPNTPKEAFGKVDTNGCPLDGDGDGVPDYLDRCLDTPAAAIGKVDAEGCSLDTDSDGIYDYLDKCPNTPANIKVDSVGCPLDQDGDSVPDYLDQCPNTPVEARGHINENGCLIDSDNDSVPNYLDQCPNTPAEAKGHIDAHGCLIDSDNDSIPDYLDQCPNTPKEARGHVDIHGCVIDSDNDSIPDYLDNCPKIAGTKSNHGCPEIKKEVKKLFQKALQGIQFKTGKAEIIASSYSILDQIAKVMLENSTYLLEINGHTDNVGVSANNLTLSQNRADAVKEYLKKKNVPENRMTAKGYGDTKPVANNAKESGRKLNRRVEFVVNFEEITLE